MFRNSVMITGGTQDLRTECIADIKDNLLTGMATESVLNAHSNIYSRLSIDTSWAPFDNPLLDLAAKYLALDFEVKFQLLNKQFEPWEGVLYVVDQELSYLDNFDAPTGVNCGNIYGIKANGGFPECLKELLGLLKT